MATAFLGVTHPSVLRPKPPGGKSSSQGSAMDYCFTEPKDVERLHLQWPLDVNKVSSTWSLESHQINMDKIHRRKAECDVEKNGVKQSIYTNWIKNELDSEKACLELPFTIILLVSFAILALSHLGQDQIIKVEEAITNDINENSNFAFAHAFGHKGLVDVNSYADFWSWSRLGLLPLLTPAYWQYSELLDEAVALPSDTSNTTLPNTTALPYDITALPLHRNYGPQYQQKLPIRNDYLRYNRIIGGFRYRQQVAPKFIDCVPVGDNQKFEAWRGKRCTGTLADELPPDDYETESFLNPERVEWFLTEKEDHGQLLGHIVDMEDGCTVARSQGRECLCKWCSEQTPAQPWLNETTRRIEISFMVYNAQYGIYSMACINFWFTRAGQIHKLVNARSCWAGMDTRPTSDLFTMICADVIWLASILYVCICEGHEILELIRSKPKRWYITLVDDYLGFWNLVDWISIFVAFLILVCFAIMYATTVMTNNELGDLVVASQNGALTKGERLDQVMNFYDTAENMLGAEKTFRFWLSIYPLILMLRLFKSFAAQPRLAIVTDTFKVAKNDLLHFFIVFLSVYFCFSVNAVLFLGQDSVNFATLTRALHSSFRIMNGDWDWDELAEIGLLKAFLWFSTYLLVMVLILLNMLLAILMESYAVVKAAADNAITLPKQMTEMWRRHRQFKKGSRVRLNDIWDALLELEGTNEEKLLASDKIVYPTYLQEHVPSIPKIQAKRTLTSAQTKYNDKHDPAFSAEDLQDTVDRLTDRLENTAKCSVWLAQKFRDYQGTELARMDADGSAELDRLGNMERMSMAMLADPTRPTSPSGNGESQHIEPGEDVHFKEGLEAINLIGQERTKALADGVSSVLQEEMQSLERRQRQQQQSMEQARTGVQALRELVAKLNQTSLEISQLSAACSDSRRRQGQNFRLLPISSGELAKGTLAIADAHVPDASRGSDVPTRNDPNPNIYEK